MTTEVVETSVQDSTNCQPRSNSTSTTNNNHNHNDHDNNDNVVTDDEAKTMEKVLQQVDRCRTNEIAEAQATQPVRRGQSVVTTHNNDNPKHSKQGKEESINNNKNDIIICGDDVSTPQRPTSRQSSFDSRKWELRVSKQEALAMKNNNNNNKSLDAHSHSQQQQQLGVANSTTNPVTTTTTTTSSSISSSAASVNTNTTGTETSLIGAFRMRPSSMATSAREYDPSDDYTTDLNAASSHHQRQQQQHHGQRQSNNNNNNNNNERGLMVDISEKEASRQRNGIGDDILIEATLVAGDEATPATAMKPPTIVPEEPELVTAEPMTAKQLLDPYEDEHVFSLQKKESEIQQKHKYRMIIAGLLCLSVTFLLVAGIALGVSLNKNNDDDDNSNNKETTPVVSVPLTRKTLPAFSRAALDDPNSPQSKAFAWYEKDIPSSSNTDLISYFPLQRFALATMYYALAGSDWTEQELWLEENTDPCDWYTTYHAQICTRGDRRRNLRILQGGNSDGTSRRYYQQLSLFENNLVGTLPPELSLLSKLDVVNLHGNSISGAIPSELGLWQDATLVQLTNNSLTSTLPTELGQLSQIKTLTFAYNQITGVLPTELAHLTTMEVFSMSNNRLQGTIPTEFGLLSNLEGLFLYENPELGGTLPSQLGELRKLNYLHLDNVPRLEGKLPTELGLLPDVQDIQLHHTNITGSIPSQLGQLSQLTSLALHDTRLTGAVPTEVCALKEIGVLQEISIDCEMVKCTCECDCTRSSSGTKSSITNVPVVGEDSTTTGLEFITDAPITVSDQIESSITQTTSLQVGPADDP